MSQHDTMQKFGTKARRTTKHARQRLAPHERVSHSLVHIVGCQRSGTTLMTEILDRRSDVRVHGELEHLFDDVPRHHRLLDLDTVRHRLDSTGAAVDVVKPLVESHRVGELLQLREGAVALWMFRRYGDVAASNLRRFGAGNGESNLRPVLDDDPHDWRNAGVSAEVRHTVRSFARRDLRPHDAAALFWYCRNSLYRTQRLEHVERVRTCQYEELVQRPDQVVGALCCWIGLDDDAVDDQTDMVRTDSLGKGDGADISPEVRALCELMWDDLVDIHASRTVLRADAARP